MEIFREVSNVRFIDSYQLWHSVTQFNPDDKCRQLMKNGGVQFYDKEFMFVKQPSVAITGVGGIPIIWTDNTPGDSIELSCSPNSSLTLPSLRQSMLDMIGFGGFFSYLNPQHRSPQEIQQIMSENGHFSTAHGAYLNIIVLGISTSVENEFNCQRDLIHLARHTEARSQSQSNPSVVVLFPEFLDTYKKILDYTRNSLAGVPLTELNKPNSLEVRNLVFPAAKATILGINASVRNLQKLVESITDIGKEEEYRRVLALMNDNLAALIPEMFEPSVSKGFKYPGHFNERIYYGN